MLIVQIDGKIHFCELDVLVLFSDCITGFSLVRTYYHLEMEFRFPCGSRGVYHWPKDGVQAEQWLESNFPNCPVERGEHRVGVD